MNAIFWNVDTQYDFMRETGKLMVAGARNIEPYLRRLTQLAADYQIKVVNTADDHDPDSAEISANPDFKETFPAHCIKGTIGAEYVKATQPKDPYIIDWRTEEVDYSSLIAVRNIVIKKDAFDVFKGRPQSPHAEYVLDVIKPELAVVYGVATDVCVNYAVRGLLDRNIRVYVATDAIKELPEEISGKKLEQILEIWKEAGARLGKTADIEMMIKDGYRVK